MHLVHRQAHGKGVAHVPDALGAGLAQLFSSVSRSWVFRSCRPRPLPRPRRAFWKDSWKVRPMAMTSPTTSSVWSGRLAAGEFFERKARDLGDHVVDDRLERGGRGAAGDFVLQFVQV